MDCRKTRLSGAGRWHGWCQTIAQKSLLQVRDGIRVKSAPFFREVQLGDQYETGCTMGRVDHGAPVRAGIGAFSAFRPGHGYAVIAMISFVSG
ncbi:hypothetical protein ATO67_11090 [Agrobacterium bohemicum]|uniref:Uncharacterized protein n=1 Tax=Agrobacterium bohemicum TaxID=2052828 RepID=A0A135NZL7_9HYPH|nr:hypothetical protein ATO67_11090 [Agrobacterium bohemicum]